MGPEFMFLFVVPSWVFNYPSCRHPDGVRVRNMCGDRGAHSIHPEQDVLGGVWVHPGTPLFVVSGSDPFS